LNLEGYLPFQLYVGSEKGKLCVWQSLPVIVKNWQRKRGRPAPPGSVIVDSDGSFAFIEFLELYATLPTGIRLQLDGILSLV
jgi:hypothetical protein